MKFDYSHYYSQFHNESKRHLENQFDYYDSLLWNILRERNKTAQILEIGCGRGYCMRYLHNRGFEKIVGLEISAEQYEFCKEIGLNVELVEETETYLNNNNGKYDLILAFDVLEHIPINSQMFFCKRIHSALSDEGIFIMTTPNANASLASRYRYNDWTHVCSFTEHSLSFVLKNSGFNDVHIGSAESWIKPTFNRLFRPGTVIWLLLRIKRLFNRIGAILELGKSGRDIPLSLNLLAIGKK